MQRASLTKFNKTGEGVCILHTMTRFASGAKRLGLLVFCLCGLSWFAQAQHRLSTDGPAIVNEDGENVLLRGMGLGGWMVQEGYMLQTAGFANNTVWITASLGRTGGPLTITIHDIDNNDATLTFSWKDLYCCEGHLLITAVMEHPDVVHDGPPDRQRERRLHSR